MWKKYRTTQFTFFSKRLGLQRSSEVSWLICVLQVHTAVETRPVQRNGRRRKGKDAKWTRVRGWFTYKKTSLLCDSNFRNYSLFFVSSTHRGFHSLDEVCLLQKIKMNARYRARSTALNPWKRQLTPFGRLFIDAKEVFWCFDSFEYHGIWNWLLPTWQVVYRVYVSEIWFQSGCGNIQLLQSFLFSNYWL